MREKRTTRFLRANILGLAVCGTMLAQGQGKYVTGDFHQHTTYTDGTYTIGYMMEKSNQFGLDWWANSEHGGGFNRWGIADGLDLGTSVTWDKTGIVLQGKANGNNMWRWQSLTDWSFRDVLLYRRVFPNKLIIQAYEMNVSTHEHASMGLIGNQFNATSPDVKALALFEYLFDANDGDDSQPFGTTEVKNATNDHTKAVASVAWLQANYPMQSWVIPAHPERYRYSGSTGWNIEHIRDLNNAAPDVFFGFESFPGHQMSAARGEYGNATSRPPLGSYGLCTYGGCGWMSAKVGGLWDALLSEGRHYWLFANSDCHSNEVGAGDFFPGEYQKTYTHVTNLDAQSVVNGMRSGNSWVVSGDLIDSLIFNISGEMMGETLNTDNDSVIVYIKVRNPQKDNHNRYGGTKRPNLDHIDLIAGVVSGKVTPPATVPADGQTGYSDAYKCDTVSTTHVIARFGASAASADPCGVATIAWTDLGNGWKEISFKTVLPQSKMYFRLRGTNHPLNTANETDACGNPLADTLVGANNGEKAFADLWFYTNPIFVEYSSTGIVGKVNDIDNIHVYPNPTNDYIYVKGANIKEVKIFNMLGMVVAEQLNFTNGIDIKDLASGIYTVQIKTDSGIIINKKIVKQVK